MNMQPHCMKLGGWMVNSSENSWITGFVGFRAIFISVCGILLTLILPWIRPVTATDIEPVRMGYVHLPPLSYTKNGKPAGLRIEIAHKLFAILDLKYEMIEMPVLRGIRDFTAGRVHVTMAAIGPKLAAIGMASKRPAGVVRLSLYSMRLEQPLSLENLTDAKLILVKGFTYGGLIQQQKFLQKTNTLLEAMDHQSAFSMLKAGRAEYLLGYARPSSLAMQGIDLQNVGRQLVEEIPFYIFVSRNAPQPEKLLSLLEGAMKLLPAENKDILVN